MSVDELPETLPEWMREQVAAALKEVNADPRFKALHALGYRLVLRDERLAPR